MTSSRFSKGTALGAAFWLLTATMGLGAPDTATVGKDPKSAPASGHASKGSQEESETILREIDDPHTGARWLLVSDSQHPGGPGRMVLAGVNTHAMQATAAATEQTLPVIQSGDHLVIEEHTRVMDARLEAIAMGTARKGAELQARLKVTGTVVKVIAVAPGRAEFAPEWR